jgi:ABC-type antimicrobial peptide transport system permease subunit
VARDIMMESMHDDRHVVYLPAALDTRARWEVFVRPRQVSTVALAEIVRAAKAQGVELQFGWRQSFWVEFFLLPFYALAVTSGALGALALGMASVGLFGLMTFSVNQRVREIGIRMALGATAKAVMGLFVRQGMRLVMIGLALGLMGGALFALALGKIMHGIIDAFDPVAFAAVTALFAVIAVFACWLPARRATKVDPMVALRAE